MLSPSRYSMVECVENPLYLMKFAFFGTPDFAAIILEKLITHELIPSVVVCNPDRPKGRKRIITSPTVKIIAQNHNIKVCQPEKLDIRNSDLGISMLDFGVVASYGSIIPKSIIKQFRLGVIGVHPSLLPKYRGSSPIQSAILEGEKETGVTLFLMDEKIDHGPIIEKSKILISKSETYETLHNKLAELSGDLLIEVIPKFMKGEIRPETQDESQATYTKKFITQDAYVDLEKDSPEMIWRKIRALNPEPGVWTIWNRGEPFDSAQGKRMKILEVDFNNGKLQLKKIQFEGKTPETL